MNKDKENEMNEIQIDEDEESVSDKSADNYGQLETSDSSEIEEEDDKGTFEPKEWHEDFLKLLPKIAKGKKL